MRWFWIDRFVEFRRGEFARAVKNVSAAEEQLRDHFPGYPMMPGSLVIEGMAQTGGILVGEAKDFKDMVVLAKLSRVEFFDAAVPGDELTYEARMIELRDEGAVVEAKAMVNGRPLADAEIVFGHVDRSSMAAAASARYASFKDEWLQMLGVPQHASADPESTATPS
jgi:3-hydroxyacyl-[acyl-carrier-protein] dehydratase